MAEKQYSSVLDLVKDSSSEKSFAEDLDQEIKNRRISKALFAMRCKAGLTQSDIARKMKCSQGKVSKIENATDMQLSIDDIAAYSSAVGMRLEIGFSDFRMTMVDKVKWHFFQLKRLINDMLKMAKGDGAVERGVAQFTTEAFVNVTMGLADCVRRARPTREEKKQAIHVSNPVSIEDLQPREAGDLSAVS
jgi:transcriptional regulator with XRE-family HTH domain